MYPRASQLHRVFFANVLASLGIYGATVLGLGVFYVLVPEPITIYAKDKKSWTFLNPESYTSLLRATARVIS